MSTIPHAKLKRKISPKKDLTQLKNSHRENTMRIISSYIKHSNKCLYVIPIEKFYKNLDHECSECHSERLIYEIAKEELKSKGWKVSLSYATRNTESHLVIEAKSSCSLV